ncbi:uncharacterized protein LOC133185095 [Saccostrea echinata]|uniref:uncharacterized protein LOC133185095 n=1 Tax=Saccostrea echinata TaxID=191078 RepID=UPI002A7F8330|nr:uncharacterized protein LOC133185095 [Saccostrea echinata]
MADQINEQSDQPSLEELFNKRFDRLEKTFTCTIESLTQEFHRAEERFRLATEELRLALQKIEDLEKRLTENKNEITRLSSLLDDRNSQLNERDRELERKDTEIRELERQLDQRRRENERMQREKEAQQRKSSELKRENERLEREKNELKAEIEKSGGYTMFLRLKSTLTVLFGLKSTSHFFDHLSISSRSLVRDCVTFVAPLSTMAYKEVSSAKTPFYGLVLTRKAKVVLKSLMETIFSTIKDVLQNQAEPYHLEIAIQIRNNNIDDRDQCLCKTYEWDVGLDGLCLTVKETPEKPEVLSDKPRKEQIPVITTSLSEEGSSFTYHEVNDVTVNNSRTEEQFKSIQSTLLELCNGIKKIEESKSSTKAEKDRKRLPSPIRKVANKYQHAFAYAFIRQFGRLLQLDERHLDEVEQYSGYGTKEVFWQIIRIWMENSESQHMTVSNLLTALSECGVDLKGKQMSKTDRTILRSKMAILLESVNPVEALVPYLCSRHLLCEVTKAYVTAPKTSDLKINRLVDILITKENGLTDFCSVLRDGGYDYIAQDIEAERSVASLGTASRLSSLSSSTSNSFPSLRESMSDSNPHLRRIAEDYIQKHGSLSSVFRKGSDTSLHTTAKVAAVSPNIQRKLTPQSNDITIKPDCVQEKTHELDEAIDNETISLVSNGNKEKCSCNVKPSQNAQLKQKKKCCCVLM